MTELDQALETIARLGAHRDEVDHQSIASQFERELIEAHTLLEEIIQHATLGTPPWYVIPDHLIERAKVIVGQSAPAGESK